MCFFDLVRASSTSQWTIFMQSRPFFSGSERTFRSGRTASLCHQTQAEPSGEPTAQFTPPANQSGALSLTCLSCFFVLHFHLILLVLPALALTPPLPSPFFSSTSCFSPTSTSSPFPPYSFIPSFLLFSSLFYLLLFFIFLHPALRPLPTA